MAKRRVRTWLRHIGADIRESTDASLLAALRLVGLLYGRIDRNLPIDQALRRAWSRRLPSHVGWKHAFGGIAYLLFMVLIVSAYCSPSTIVRRWTRRTTASSTSRRRCLSDG